MIKIKNITSAVLDFPSLENEMNFISYGNCGSLNLFVRRQKLPGECACTDAFEISDYSTLHGQSPKVARRMRVYKSDGNCGFLDLALSAAKSCQANVACQIAMLFSWWTPFFVARPVVLAYIAKFFFTISTFRKYAS